MKKIIFDKKIDCIICLNGELNFEDLHSNVFSKLQNTPIWAADGAVNKLLANNIKPSKIIGDFDSIDNCDSNSEMIKILDQNKYDFEKTLDYAKENNLQNCLILGINGGEYEHSLNNWSILKKYSKIMNLCVYTEQRYGFFVDENILINLEINEIVSIIPSSKAVISSKNLNWELNKCNLEIGVTEGARNFAKGEIIELILHKGDYFLFVDAKIPFIQN